MFKNSGLLISKLGECPSHPEMLKNLGFSKSEIDKNMKDVPRGYYKEGRVAIYQEYEIDKPGYVLEVKPENENVVKEYLKDLKLLLELDQNTDVYMGMIVGKIGDDWKLIRHSKLSESI